MRIFNRKRLALSLIAAVLVFISLRFRLQQTLVLGAAAAQPLPPTAEVQPFRFANTTAAVAPPLEVQPFEFANTTAAPPLEVQPIRIANPTAAAAPPLGPDTALLIICANRPQYLQRSLDAIQKHYPRHSTAAAAPVVRVSQDGDSSDVAKVISSFTASMQDTAAVQHLRYPQPTVAPTGDESIGRH
jgi:hypothetical protein